MADVDEMRGKARELAEISERLESVAELQDALESTVDRYRRLCLARFTDLTTDEVESLARIEDAISDGVTQRLALASHPFMDWFISSEVSGGAFDSFRRAWPRVGAEISREIARSDEASVQGLRRAILGLFVDGFVVSSTFVAAADGNEAFPDGMEQLITQENLVRVQRTWTTGWRYHASLISSSDWAVLGAVSEPSRREFGGALDAIGVSARKRRRKRLEQATFGYLGAGYSLYRSFTKDSYVYELDAFTPFTYEGFSWG